MNIINQKKGDQIGYDAHAQSARIQGDRRTNNEDVLLSDMIRTSNVGQNRVLNNSNKSPFQTFSKEGESV